MRNEEYLGSFHSPNICKCTNASYIYFANAFESHECANAIQSFQYILIGAFSNACAF